MRYLLRAYMSGAVMACISGWPLHAMAPTGTIAAGTNILWGINESGLDFGNGNKVWKNFVVPDPAYYLAHGVQLVRIPFQISRVQPIPNQPLSPEIVGYLKKIIAEDHAAGAVTVLDPHGYGFFPMNGKPADILKDPAAAAAYVDFMQRLAAQFAQNDVAIGLMNEPHAGSDTDYAVIWNQAIQAMRHAGFHGVIVVPHAHWSTAADISPGTPYQGKIIDPDKNWVLELHSYLDPDGSGTYKQPIASANIGAQRLAGAIAWSRQSGIRIFLGETGTPPDPASITALRLTLDEIKAAPDVFWGVAMWGGGPWWKPNYAMRLDPINGVDTPQFIALEQEATPETLYLAKDPNSPDVKLRITVNGKLIAPEVTVSAPRMGAPQAVPLRYGFKPGTYGIEILPGSGNAYFLGSTWKGKPNSASPVGEIQPKGTKVQIQIPAG